MADLGRAVRAHQRDASTVGHVERRRGVLGGKPVLAGTRVPVDTVRRFKPAAEAYQSVADSARSVRDAPQPWSPDTREGALSARSEARHHGTGFPERRETDGRGRISPGLISARPATYRIARRWPAAEPVFGLRRRFDGPVAFSSATRSPRDNHVRRAALPPWAGLARRGLSRDSCSSTCFLARARAIAGPRKSP